MPGFMNGSLVGWRPESPPLQAILLAAGEGSRLRPFTMDKPKPMIRAANKPIVQYAVEALVANGVKEITLVVGYQRAKVQSFFGDGHRFGARITYAFQEALTGTTQALASVATPREPVLVLGADNVIGGGVIKDLLAAPGSSPAMVVYQSEAPSRYGVVTLDGNVVARIEEKPPVPQSHWVNTGVYRIDPPTFERAKRLASAGVTGLTDVLQSSIDEGARVVAVKSEDLWSDAVYPWDLLRVHADVLRNGNAKPPRIPDVHAEAPVRVGEDCTIGPGTVVGTGTCIGDNVEIGPHCVIENCVVYDDVKLGAGSILRNTIIGEGTRIGPRFTALSDACDIRTIDGWHHLDDFGSIIGEDARVSGCVTAMAGTVLGNRARVMANRTLQGNLEDDSVVM